MVDGRRLMMRCSCFEAACITMGGSVFMKYDTDLIKPSVCRKTAVVLSPCCGDDKISSIVSRGRV